MTSLTKAEDSYGAQEILDSLLESTVVDQVVHHFDLCLAEYNYPEHDVKSTNEFNDEITRFIQHIYRHARTPHQNLSSREALAEAIHILKQCSEIDDYSEALIKATTTAGAGVNYVLECIAKAVRDSEIRKTFDLIFSKTVDPSNWKLQIEITEILFRDFGSFLRPEIAAGSPTQFAGECRRLAEVVKNSLDTIRQLAGPFGLTAAE